MTWTLILILGAGSYLLRVLGLALVESRHLPSWAQVPLEYLPAALLAALVIAQTVGGDSGITIDARLPGVAAAGLAAWRQAPMVVVVLVGVATTALLRAAGFP